jgi:hypothetical protein
VIGCDMPSVDLTGWSPAALVVNPPRNFVASFNVQVRATKVHADNGSTATATATRDLTVNVLPAGYKGKKTDCVFKRNFDSCNDLVTVERLLNQDPDKEFTTNLEHWAVTRVIAAALCRRAHLVDKGYAICLPARDILAFCDLDSRAPRYTQVFEHRPQDPLISQSCLNFGRNRGKSVEKCASRGATTAGEAPQARL